MAMRLSAIIWDSYHYGAVLCELFPFIISFLLPPTSISINSLYQRVTHRKWCILWRLDSRRAANGTRWYSRELRGLIINPLRTNLWTWQSTKGKSFPCSVKRRPPKRPLSMEWSKTTWIQLRTKNILESDDCVKLTLHSRFY